MKCCTCRAPISEGKEGLYHAFDLQKCYEEVIFCSKECLDDWVIRKRIGMWLSFVIGAVISVLMLISGEAVLALPFLFLPYTLRQLQHGLNGSGGFFSFAVVLLSSITVVYPAYKFIQEYLQYKKLKSSF